MVLAENLSRHIVSAAISYLGKPFDWDTFNCVHYVRRVYVDVGITLPILDRHAVPPREFHLSTEEFAHMPIGHSVFFRRIAKNIVRPWSHVAIIVSRTELIHCTRHMGNGVIVTPKDEFLKVYSLAPRSQF